MMALFDSVLVVGAAVSGGIGAAALTSRQLRNIERTRRRSRAMDAQRSSTVIAAEMEELPQSRVIGYMESLTRRLYAGATSPLSPVLRRDRSHKKSSGRWFYNHARIAGCAKRISADAFCEAQFRLCLLGLLVGALFGSVFSIELALLLAIGGSIAGWIAPRRALIRAAKQRAIGAELHLSEMLEIIALGLRSGLTFDRSFAMYGSYFNNSFARSCTRAYRSWSLGLSTREEALRDLAASYDCEQLSRVVDSIVRSLRYGTTLAPVLEEAGAQARATYRASLEEKVAKAPIKMMMPTGTLILPAMLLLVLGPVLLELMQGF